MQSAMVATAMTVTTTLRFKLKRVAVIGLLAFCLPAVSTQAQVSSFRVAVPFPFVVGTQTLPSGTYVVQRYLGQPRHADDTGVIVMKANNHHIYKVIVTGASEQRKAAKLEGSRLVFTSFQGKQYLNRVLVAGDPVAHQLANVPADIAAQGAGGEVIVTSFQPSRGK